MSSDDWNDALDRAKHQEALDAAARRSEQTAAAQAAEAHRHAQELAAPEITRLVLEFHNALVQAEMPGSERIVVRRPKKPWFRPRDLEVQLVVVPDAGLSWYRWGTDFAFESSIKTSLMFGKEQRPSFGGCQLRPWWDGREYERLRVTGPLSYSIDTIDGLRDMLEHPSSDPASIVTTVRDALATWTARNAPDLRL